MLGKMTTQTLLFLLSIISLNTNAEKLDSKKLSVQNPLVKESSKPQSNASSIVFLRSFFKWYKTKFDYLDNHIFPVAMDLKGNSPYRINFNETEKYLATLKSSGFFSDNYIRTYRDYFKEIDLTLQKTKQNDGTVDGLDYDLILHSQEPQSTLKHLARIQLHVVKSSTNRVLIKVKTEFDETGYYLYHLIKEGDKYLIDKIDFF